MSCFKCSDKCKFSSLTYLQRWLMEKRILFEHLPFSHFVNLTIKQSFCLICFKFYKLQNINSYILVYVC